MLIRAAMGSFKASQQGTALCCGRHVGVLLSSCRRRHVVFVVVVMTTCCAFVSCSTQQHDDLVEGQHGHRVVVFERNSTSHMEVESLILLACCLGVEHGLCPFLR